MRAAVVYWSKTGNTEKVARTIEQTLQDRHVDVTCHRVEEASDLDWFGYDEPPPRPSLPVARLRRRPWWTRAVLQLVRLLEFRRCLCGRR